MKIITTGSAGGLDKPYKGLLPASADTRSEYDCQSHLFPVPLLKQPFAFIPIQIYLNNPDAFLPLLVLFRWFTCKRGKQLLHHQLLFVLILYQMVPDILLYRSFVSSHGIYIIPAAPELPVPIFVFQVRKLIEDHQAAFPSDTPSRSTRYILAVSIAACGYALGMPLPPISLSPSSCIVREGSSLSPVFRCKHYMVFAVPFGILGLEAKKQLMWQ